MSNMPPFLQFSANETESEDYVKWQSSQTACVALNQLIKTSSNDSSLPENAGTSRGWQREPSFDQIPGFSLLSTNDAFTSSSSSSLTKTATTPLSASRSRPRPSMARHRPSAVPHGQTNVITPIPSGTKLLDIMKGVSASLDENVQVRSRTGRGRASLLGPMRTKDKKKARNGIPDLQAGRPKKSLIDPLRQAEPEGRTSTDKGKGRAAPTSDEHALLLDGPLLETGRSRIAGVDSGEKSGSTVLTSSQDQMPPPPAPLSRNPLLGKTMSTAVITSEFVVPEQPPISRPTLQHKHPHPTRTKLQGLERVPQLHPLLLKPSSSSSSVSSSKPQPPSKSTSPEASTTLRNAQAPLKSQTILSKETKPTIRPVYPPSKPFEASQSVVPSSTPNPASSQSSRPPALGMRRTHTFPAPGMSTSLQKTGALPTRQKAFKSPLLPGSQPQPQAQRQQHKYDGLRDPTASNGSSSSDSPSGSSSSFMSASTAASTPSRSSVSPSGASRKTLTKTDARSPLARSASISAATPSSAPMDIPVDVGSLPEPSDGDGDSSFGDMSFDMDALEETMRQYD